MRYPPHFDKAGINIFSETKDLKYNIKWIYSADISNIPVNLQLIRYFLGKLKEIIQNGEKMIL